MLDEAQDFRISIAGVQEKTALLWYNERWQLPHGLTPTTHIIKLPIGKIQTPKYQLDLSQSVDNELICLRLCAAFGLPTANVNLLEVRDVRVLVVERFDRKLHSPNPAITEPAIDAVPPHIIANNSESVILLINGLTTNGASV
ncbi:HipA domain-containing protein [Actinobacillus capsulatus]|uniref:HipA domain-containing protein n=1 Tax=Actinobacillus capsulatus TaxID=717 RepID=UPI0003A9DFEB|nr:HipA domain-containing protein [Actinobacillus capsulatus]